jgi:hypothetical protein
MLDGLLCILIPGKAIVGAYMVLIIPMLLLVLALLCLVKDLDDRFKKDRHC